MPDGQKSLTFPTRWVEIQNVMLGKSGDAKFNPGKRALIGWGKQEARNPKDLVGKTGGVRLEYGSEQASGTVQEAGFAQPQM